MSTTNTVPLDTNNSKLAPSAFSERNVAMSSTSIKNSMLNNLNTETSQNNILIESNMNVASPLIIALLTSENADVIDALNSQPWLVSNSAASMLTYNLPSRMSTAPSLDVSDELLTLVMAETELSVVGPQ